MNRRAILKWGGLLALMAGCAWFGPGTIVLAAGSGAASTGKSSGRRGAAKAGAKTAERAPVTESVSGVNDIDPHKAFGSKSAPIVMEVFSDYQCPSCRAFYLGTNRQLMDNYVSTGKVFLVHRDFPLQMHAYSRIAARYARAAAEIGKIDIVDQTLFENQEKWEQTGDVDGTVAAVLSPAEMTKVRALVKGGTLEPLISKDYELGEMYRVNSTPTTVFHCKGQTYPYAGGMSYEILSHFLDQLLKQR
ncbi:MAG TPA: thioredoxin domain-containing protein [Candidatus Acidoferrum sp.]|nr:thioredoxin domain-containing protein [Candidatus Acidoferrum sp.]